MITFMATHSYPFECDDSGKRAHNSEECYPSRFDRSKRTYRHNDAGDKTRAKRGSSFFSGCFHRNVVHAADIQQRLVQDSFS